MTIWLSMAFIAPGRNAGRREVDPVRLGDQVVPISEIVGSSAAMLRADPTRADPRPPWVRDGLLGRDAQPYPKLV